MAGRQLIGLARPPKGMVGLLRRRAWELCPRHGISGTGWRRALDLRHDGEFVRGGGWRGGDRTPEVHLQHHIRPRWHTDDLYG